MSSAGTRRLPPNTTPPRLGMDLHHNVFGYYRGPSRRMTGDALEVHRQVEDNTTKALINTLELADEDELGRRFVRRFAPELPAFGGRVDYRLQPGTPSTPGAAIRLLGISVLGETDSEAPVDGSGGSRPDAALVLDGVGALVIEVKTVDRLDSGQLARHAREWGADPAAVRLVRWAEIWEWAREERVRSASGLSRFLLSQLCDYLEQIGLAPWAGFTEGDFAFFVAPSADRAAAIRNRMGGLWPRVLAGLEPKERASLLPVEVGRLSPVVVWAQTNRAQRLVNFSAELYAEELQLNVVGWNKAPADTVERALDAGSFPSLPVELVVHERIFGRTRSGKVHWQREIAHPIRARFSFDELRAGLFDSWRETWRLEETSLAAYHLRRVWSRGQVLGRGEGIVEEVRDDVRRLLPWLLSISPRPGERD